MDWTQGMRTPYETLELEPEATDAEIRKAFKLQALKKHPDKNKNNPAAAAEFGEVESAYRVLTDASAKGALDDYLRAKAEREARHSMRSDKRRKLKEDLDRKEKEVVTERREEDTARCRLQAELQRLRRKVEEEQEGAALRTRQANEAAAAARMAEAMGGGQAADAATHAQLARTLKVVWDAGGHEYTPDDLRQALGAHGTVEDVVVRSSKKKKHGGGRSQASALVVMGSEVAAHAAVNSVNGHPESPLLVLPLLKVAPHEAPQAPQPQPHPQHSSYEHIPHPTAPPPSTAHLVQQQQQQQGSTLRPSQPKVSAAQLFGGGISSSSSTGAQQHQHQHQQQPPPPSSFPIHPAAPTTSFPAAAHPNGPTSSFPIPQHYHHHHQQQQQQQQHSSFSSFPGGVGFGGLGGGGVGWGGGGEGNATAVGGAESEILQKMRRAAERERQLAAAKREAAEEAGAV